LAGIPVPICVCVICLISSAAAEEDSSYVASGESPLTIRNESGL